MAKRESHDLQDGVLGFTWSALVSAFMLYPFAGTIHPYTPFVLATLFVLASIRWNILSWRSMKQGLELQELRPLKELVKMFPGLDFNNAVNARLIELAQTTQVDYQKVISFQQGGLSALPPPYSKDSDYDITRKDLSSQFRVAQSEFFAFWDFIDSNFVDHSSEGFDGVPHSYLGIELEE
ncbi:hypothetical protein HZA26_01860 [Candidatus Nomurabacteria bacterium]|nr:hypothetical protein [Candidatus Nomurabacteria bacterium]